jgi:hypothetical protein
MPLSRSGSRRRRGRGFEAPKKGEISTPIITILVTVAALAVTGMTISWMASTGAMASSQGAIIILGSPVVQNDTLYLTLKNIGTVSTTVDSCILGGINSASISPHIVPAGNSTAMSVGFGFTFASGQVLKGSIITDQGTFQFSAFVQ